MMKTCALAAVVLAVSVSASAQDSMMMHGQGDIKKATLILNQSVGEDLKAGSFIYIQDGVVKPAKQLERRKNFVRITIGKDLPQGIKLGKPIKVNEVDGPVASSDGFTGLDAIGYTPEGKGPHEIQEIACFAPDGDPLGALGLESGALEGVLKDYGTFTPKGSRIPVNKIADGSDPKRAPAHGGVSGAAVQAVTGQLKAR